MTEQVLSELLIADIYPSPTNPRKHFDEAKLQELAASIAVQGVLEPILVRDNPNGKARYEIAAGDRRHRAAKIAGLETMPCLVRELTDIDVLEIQTIENMQRDDLHPLEEADGYAQLMKRAGYDVATIAAKIGRSEKYVYDRVNLLQLTPAAKKVFLDGEIAAGHAILLARLTAEDQARAIGSGKGDWRGLDGGLFQEDLADEAPGLELDDRRKRKPVSVRELDTWINDNVRFKPDEVDLPNLFPETATTLAAAQEEELKVVKITHDYRVPDAARDEKERTYGEASWKRADGEPAVSPFVGKPKKSKTCEHSVMGVIVAGPGRGQAFRVCVAKKKCKVHWAQEQREAASRAKARERGHGSGAGKKRESYEDQQKRREEERRRREEEQARWRKAKPKLLAALTEKLKKAPVSASSPAAQVVIKACGPSWGGKLPQGMKPGRTADDLIRYCAYVSLYRVVADEYQASSTAQNALGAFGIDAKKIVDEVAPKAGGLHGAEEGGPVKKGARKRGVQTAAKNRKEAV